MYQELYENIRKYRDSKRSKRGLIHAHQFLLGDYIQLFFVPTGLVFVLWAEDVSLRSEVSWPERPSDIDEFYVKALRRGLTEIMGLLGKYLERKGAPEVLELIQLTPTGFKPGYYDVTLPVCLEVETSSGVAVG